MHSHVEVTSYPQHLLSLRTRNIPAELKLLPQWVVARSASVEGSRRICGYSHPVSFVEADPRLPQTWGTFEEALGAVVVGVANSIHFVLTGADYYCAVELHRCRDSASDTISPVALRLVRLLDTYTEVSNGGSSMMMLCRAQRPGRRSQRGLVRICDRRGFVQITGTAVSEVSAEIEDRQREVEFLYDELVG